MILYTVIHSQKQNDRVRNIKETWGKNKNIIFYSDHEDINNNIYKVSDNTEYNSGQEKQIKIFQLLKNKFQNYEWYMFVDNDTFVNTSLVEVDLNQFDKSRVIGNIINCWAKNPFLLYPSGGAGFLIHRLLIEKFWEQDLTVFEGLDWGDVAIGLLCKSFGIHYAHSPKFCMFEPTKYPHIKDQINFSDANNNYTFHYIKDFDMMNKLYNACN